MNDFDHPQRSLGLQTCHRPDRDASAGHSVRPYAANFLTDEQWVPWTCARQRKTPRFSTRFLASPMPQERRIRNHHGGAPVCTLCVSCNAWAPAIETRSPALRAHDAGRKNPPPLAGHDFSLPHTASVRPCRERVGTSKRSSTMTSFLPFLSQGAGTSKLCCGPMCQ